MVKYRGYKWVIKVIFMKKGVKVNRIYMINGKIRDLEKINKIICQGRVLAFRFLKDVYK